MRACDLPDSPLASFDPDIAGAADSPRDFLREVFGEFTGPLPDSLPAFRQLAFRLIDDALTIITGELPAGSGLAAWGAKASGPEKQNEVIRLLNMLRYAKDSRLRLDALCFLRIMGDEGRSFDEIGEAAGLGAGKKGTAHKRYREIQRLLGGLPGRGDKSPEARQKYRHLREGQRRQRAPWSGAGAWAKPLALAA
jgi:hypothetical protein